LADTGITSEVFIDEPAYFVGRLVNLGVVVWHQTPTLERVNSIRATLDRLEQEPHTGFAVMAVVTPGCAPVGAEIRSAFDGAMRAYRDAVLGMAAVIEVTGVLGGLTRAIARTLSVVSRSPYPLNTYTNIDTAAQWLPDVMAQRGAPRVTSRQIIETVDSVRR